MRHSLILTLALAAQAALAQTGPVLPVPLYPQEHSNWCWAAAVQMVLAYRGLPYAQCVIANEAKGIANACDAPGDFDWSDHQANRGLPTGEYGNLFDRFGLSASVTDGHPEAAQVTALLTAGDPLIIGWKWKQADRAHSAVLTGFLGDENSGLVCINDPWPGWGASARTWAATVSAQDRDWTATVVTD